MQGSWFNSQNLWVSKYKKEKGEEEECKEIAKEKGKIKLLECNKTMPV